MAQLPPHITTDFETLPSTYHDLVKYGEMAIPSAIDECVNNILTFFLSADKECQQEIVKRFSGNSNLLTGFAFRMALQAIRTPDPAPLFGGFLALVVENLSFDARDTVVYLTLLRHAALKVGVSSTPLMKRAAQFASPECKELFEKIARKRPRLAHLKEMGFTEGTSEAGFVFCPRE